MDTPCWPQGSLEARRGDGRQPTRAKRPGGSIVSMRDFRYYVVPTGGDVCRLTTPKFGRIANSDAWHSAIVDHVVAGSRDWMLTKLETLATPGIRIDFGFPADPDIGDRGRIPLFATLIADRIKEIAGTQFVSLRLSKHCGHQTTLSVADAVPTRPPKAVAAATVLTRRSYATQGFSSEVCDAVGEVRAAIKPRESLILNLSYVTGLPRTWSRLWVPTVNGIFSTESAKDSLSDTQITELGLDHHSVGERLGHGVNISVSLCPTAS